MVNWKELDGEFLREFYAEKYDIHYSHLIVKYKGKYRLEEWADKKKPDLLPVRLFFQIYDTVKECKEASIKWQDDK